MPPRRRRFWLPLFLALLVGCGAWWVVGELLRPKPAWTLQLKEAQSAAVVRDQLIITPDQPGNRNTTIQSFEYRSVKDGQLLSVHTGRQLLDLLDDRLPPLPDPPLPPVSNRYSLTFRNRRCFLIDTHTGKQYRFHNSTAEEQHDGITWSYTQSVEVAVVTRQLPIQLAAHLLQPQGLTPIDAWTRTYAALTEGSRSTLASVITVPGKQPLGCVMVPATNSRLILQPSRTGKYLSVVEYSLIKSVADKVFGIYNLREGTWHLGFTMEYPLWGASFFEDDYLLTQSELAPEPRRCVIWHVPTQKQVSHFGGANVYGPQEHILTTAEGIQLQRISKKEVGHDVELCAFTPNEECRILGRWSLSENASYWDMKLVRGNQTSCFSVRDRQLPVFLQNYLPNSWHQWLRSWLIVPRLQIYDWNTGLLHLLARSAYGYTCHNGEYLVVCHYEQEAGRNRYTKVEGYHMPLAFSSPWWSRVAGMICCLLIFILLRLGRQQLVPTV